MIHKTNAARFLDNKKRAAGLSAPVPGHGGHSYIHEDGAVRARSQIGRALAALPESCDGVDRHPSRFINGHALVGGILRFRLPYG